MWNNKFYANGPEDDDYDDSTNPGSPDPWSDDNDGNGTDSDGGIW